MAEALVQIFTYNTVEAFGSLECHSEFKEKVHQH